MGGGEWGGGGGGEIGGYGMAEDESERKSVCFQEMFSSVLVKKSLLQTMTDNFPSLPFRMFSTQPPMSPGPVHRQGLGVRRARGLRGRFG